MPRLPGRNAFQFLHGTSGWARAVYGDPKFNTSGQLREDDVAEPGDGALPLDGIQEPRGKPELGVFLTQQAEVDMAADAWAKMWLEGNVGFIPPTGC